jgi:hypothetical protein
MALFFAYGTELDQAKVLSRTLANASQTATTAEVIAEVPRAQLKLQTRRLTPTLLGCSSWRTTPTAGTQRKELPHHRSTTTPSKHLLPTVTRLIKNSLLHAPDA